MSGHHNLTIYTGERDVKHCRECLHGELVKSGHLFQDESYICWNRNGNNLVAKCTGFGQITGNLRDRYKTL